MKFLRKAALVTALVMAAAVTGCSGKEKPEFLTALNAYSIKKR